MRTLRLATTSHLLLATPALLLFAIGCGSGPLATTPTSTSSYPALTGNWQIQSSSTPGTGTFPSAGIVLLGALSNSGGSVTGTFRFANLSLPNACNSLPSLYSVVTLSGTVDALGNLKLTSVPFSGSVISVQLVIPPVATTYAAGTIAVTGGNCAFASSPAIGVEIASISGTYSGPVTALSIFSLPTFPNGTSTLTLAQSSAAAADGQFPVTGTLAFYSGVCTASEPIYGTLSGVGLTLTSATSGQLLVAVDSVTGFVLPASSQIHAGDILYFQPPCSTAQLASPAGYSGTLTRH